jgi:hypothetical protein
LQNAVHIEPEVRSPALEKRMVLRVLDVWRRACGEEVLPAAGSLVASDMGADADHVFIIDLLHPAGPCFTQIGAALRLASWPAVEEPLVARCPEKSVLSLVSRHWPEIADRRVPVTRAGGGMNEETSVLYRGVMMPLVDESGRISAIIGAANWRTVEESHGTSSN